MKVPSSPGFRPVCTAIVGVSASLLGSTPVLAAHPTGDTMDKVADVLALVVIVVAPLIGIAVFWLVHILPEKIAEKRHHPQAETVKVICLLSLVFGGMLWPVAWIIAYTRPVLYKMAYGRDTLEETEAPARVARTEPTLEEQHGATQAQASTQELRQLRERLALLEARIAASGAGTGAG